MKKINIAFILNSRYHIVIIEDKDDIIFGKEKIYTKFGHVMPQKVIYLMKKKRKNL